jgi:hypothetical protein
MWFCTVGYAAMVLLVLSMVHGQRVLINVHGQQVPEKGTTQMQLYVSGVCG